VSSAADELLQAGLAAAAAALQVAAPAVTGAVPLLYGPLLIALAPTATDDALAFELIYEGYLLHYRHGRLLRSANREMSLLAGDFFYARGLRLVARQHDIAAVDLLARLMASCACLRAVGAPFSHDDDLWVVTVAAIGALRAGAAVGPALALFAHVHELVDGSAAALAQAARTCVRELAVSDRRPLAAFLGGDTIGPDLWLPASVAGAA
jgi:hypothetical protein